MNVWNVWLLHALSSNESIYASQKLLSSNEQASKTEASGDSSSLENPIESAASLLAVFKLQLAAQFKLWRLHAKKAQQQMQGNLTVQLVHTPCA